MIYSPDYTIQLPEGGEVHLLFNTWAIKKYCEKQGIEMEELLTRLKVKELPDLMLSAAESYARYNKQEFKATDLDACEWMDAMGGFNGPKLAEIVKTFLRRVSGLTEAEYEERVQAATEEKKREVTPLPGDPSINTLQQAV